MGISEKIEAIQKKPDHIRIRYVWGCVFVSMVFIFLIWILSVSIAFKEQPANQKQSSELDQFKKSLESSKKDLPTLEDLPKAYPQQ